ncbi:hypothetical protein M408DRAFT_325792 [Serendipita vermifera MAFF 305830]|uniref:VLRF1 domain-containing protein n=1 Tax=Serendipita vermifera MAFF 305830 TaxID=933852 RepID=A0A0C2X8J7_SERVB|nr:hypothetical protein M408DRAFT_325792 [Serendipita vermifera MAFF 305830]
MNVFQLPPDLLEGIVRRTLLSDSESQPLETSPARPPPQLLPRTTGVGCAVCINAAFTNVEDQRAHYKSDWHRYNVKAKLSNKPLLSEPQFENAIADLSDSISGSESTDSEEDLDTGDEAKKRDTVHNALRKARGASSRPTTPDVTVKIPRSPIIWFHCKPATQIGVYSAIFPTGIDSREYDYVNELKAMQQPDGERLWTLLMTAGGHFAGIVVKISSSNSQQLKVKGKHKPSEFEIVSHKTFHRYTTRRKQGGSQSLNDNAKGNAKSAGATLRRYGEQALRDDIRALMDEWREEINASERIWIRANVSNKRIFYDYEAAAFPKDDPRLRGFPFPTRRPTQAELLRCLNELLHAKVSRFTEEELRKQDEELLASLPQPKPAPVPSVPKPKQDKVPPPVKLTKEQEELRENWKRLIEMTKKGRLDALSSLWDRIHPNIQSDAGIDTRIPEMDGLPDGNSTLLQVASAAGQDSVVQWLLEEKGADPTVKTVPRKVGIEISLEAGKAPYELASTKSVRDAFRRAAGANPDRWDWLNEGRVPSVLSKEMEEEQESKKKVKRKGLKEKMKEREERQPSASAEERVEHPVEVKPSVGPQRLGGSGDAAGVMGLTPEMRARIERERRARAIEARMQSPKQ